MLGGGDVAQEGGSAHGSHGTADGGGDVVVAGSDIGHEGSQHVEGSPHADALLHLHIGGHLVEGHMAGAFHHDLHIVEIGRAHV